MIRPLRAVRRASTVALAIALCLSTQVGAQAGSVRGAAKAEEAQPLDWLQLRLRYGLSLRQGSQTDTGPGLSYTGSTPNDVALNAWTWFAVSGQLGAFVAVQREAFGLYEGSTRVMQGGLIRAEAGPAWRFAFGPVRLEPQVGYAYHQLPVFGSSVSPAFGAATRHGVLLAARALVDLGPVTVEARGAYPLVLAVSDAGGAGSGTARGFSAGGALRVQLFQTGSLHWGLLADVSYHQDGVSFGTTTSAQSVLRAGGAIDLRLRDEKPRPRFGGLTVTVVDAESSMPLPGVQAVAVQGADIRPLAAGTSGALEVAGLAAGAVTVKGSLGGYEAGEVDGVVTAGQDTPLVLKLTKEKPKVGSVKVTVVLHEALTPLAGAQVEVAGQTLTANEAGVVSLGELKPGPVAVKVTLPGHNPGEEAVSIAAGRETELTVTLVPEKKRLKATISGHVRNKKGGAPIAADLEVPEAKVKTAAGEDGAFSIEVEGGTYTVRIFAKGFIPQKKRVTVKDGDKAIFNVDLFPKK